MLTTIVTRIVAACCRHAKLVVLLAIVATSLASIYVVKNFAINTDSSKLISTELPWRKLEAAFTKAFPQNEGLILVVVDGTTPEVAQAAAASLVERISPDKEHFEFVKLPPEEAYLTKTGLLFQPLDTVKTTVDQLSKAQPLLASLSFDPSLRGLMTMVSQISIGVEQGKTPLDKLNGFFGKMADSIDGALDKRMVPFSFQQIVGDSDSALGKRRFVLIKPRLDFGNLEPGEAATNVVEKAIEDLHLTPDRGVKLRLTGQIPLEDQEFGTVKEGFALNSILTVLAVVLILWLALKSGRLIVAVFLSTFVGLILTAAAGLAAVGALNLISVAFAVLFIGIGVDFGIQFSVRYRDERFLQPFLLKAVTGAGNKAGRPLMLAAAATTAGFYSFLPTDYKGVSELGLIAGNGMIIAFLTSITLLPALITLLNPPSESREVGYSFLAPLDHFLTRHRWWVIGGTVGLALVASPLLLKVRFDFNPLNLNSPRVESVATLLDLSKSADTTPNKIDVLEPSLDAANDLAARIAKLPEVGSAKTLTDLVPPEQDPKVKLIKDAAEVLDATLNPEEHQPAPTEQDETSSMNAAIVRINKALLKVPDQQSEAVATAKRLAGSIQKLAGAPSDVREVARDAFIPAMKILIAQLSQLMSADIVTTDTIPDVVKRNWVTPTGQARIEVTPKNLDGSNDTLRIFSDAVLRVAPDATGQPVVIQDSGRSVIWAFIEAGLLAFGSIAILLFIVLRKVVDVLLTLVPLLLAGVLTMEITVLIDLPLNFANIIALPLLLGLGVAFKIYFVMAWRSGETHLLQSSLTRAVFFSAMATAVAFGSLWSSNHPGTSSMGKLLALSLACTLIAAVFFQPALMGPPRQKKPAPGASPEPSRQLVNEAAE